MTTGTIVQMASRPRVPERRRQILMIDARRWITILMISGVVTALSFPLYVGISLWVGAGVFAMTLGTCHLLASMHRLPWVPGIVIVFASIQWLIAPALVYGLPWLPTAIPPAVSAERYFSFVVPGLIALIAGLYLPLLGATARPSGAGVLSPRARQRLIGTCEQMAMAGVVAEVAQRLGLPSSLSFVFDLLGRLTFTGAFALLLLRAPQWRRWCLIAIGLQTFTNVVQTQFLELFLLLAHFGLIATYALRVPMRRVVGYGALVLTIVIAINGVKAAYRVQAVGLDAGGRVSVASRQVGSMLGDPTRLFSAENLAFNLSRLNQGAITARVLYWTPQSEPFAHGETINAAVQAALLPRILAANKASAGGENYTRFTGLPLLHGTSINLSVLGEFYANYGVVGAWLAIFVWGLLISLLFRVFQRRARSTPAWWAWVPFVMFGDLSTEAGVVEFLNEVVKASIVMVAIVWSLPAWRDLVRRDRRSAGARRDA